MDAFILRNMNIPVNVKRNKKKLRPPLVFVQAIVEHKSKKGYWPKSELELRVFNRPAVEALAEKGFQDWSIGYYTLDTLVVHFVHDPVYTQKMGVLSVPGKLVKLKTTFTTQGNQYIHTTELE